MIAFCIKNMSNLYLFVGRRRTGISSTTLDSLQTLTNDNTSVGTLVRTSFGTLVGPGVPIIEEPTNILRPTSPTQIFENDVRLSHVTDSCAI